LVPIITCVFNIHYILSIMCFACLITRKSVRKPLGEEKHLVARQIRVNRYKEGMIIGIRTWLRSLQDDGIVLWTNQRTDLGEPSLG
jgi:hypothetical protein